MDPVSMAFYAVVCAVLAVAAPGLKSRGLRVAVGVLTGAAAAFVLQRLRAATGL